MGLTNTITPTASTADTARVLEQELDWMRTVIDVRISLYFNAECAHTSIYDVPLPDLSQEHTGYATIVQDYQMGFTERFLLMLAMTPQLRPESLDVFLSPNKKTNLKYSEFGGMVGKRHIGFIPTAETALFVLTERMEHRINLLRLFHGEHYLFRHGLLELEVMRDEPAMSGVLSLGAEYLHLLVLDQKYEPAYNHIFPAQRIHSKLEWEDLILQESVLQDLEEIKTWVSAQQQIMQRKGLKKRLKPGFRALFYGPPGTGKTLAATLLGKETDYPVYRIDLSMVVSKYIGETQKNLAGLFDQAAHKNWILFFDEADALFGQRTATSDSKDRHANQEVAYLLQRIEDFNGVVILASNLKSNLDAAFARRFQSMIYFPIPDKHLRLKLWQDAFKDTFPLSENVNLRDLAWQYEIAGGSIINVLRYCALAAVSRNPQVVDYEDIKEGIRREIKKEGRTL